jgi:DNA-binding XRE family transcriptional regulator
MIKKIKTPRILKVNGVDGLTVSVVFNNGESRNIDFNKVLIPSIIGENSPAFKLLDADEFKQFKLENYTLSWANASTKMAGFDGEELDLPFEIGAHRLYELSEPDASFLTIQIGVLIKNARIEAQLTQQELAEMCGTTRTYISKIENSNADLEVSTLRKIVEVGFGKRLEIAIH